MLLGNICVLEYLSSKMDKLLTRRYVINRPSGGNNEENQE